MQNANRHYLAQQNKKKEEKNQTKNWDNKVDHNEQEQPNTDWQVNFHFLNKH